MEQSFSTLGIERCTRRCWEYGSITPGSDEGNSVAGGGDERSEDDVEEPLEIRVIAAWFGDPEHEAKRRDITEEVQRMLRFDSRVSFPATTQHWGDPARFCMKQMEITFERVWLADDERAALRALQARATEKAQEAPQLEPLLIRLGQALAGVASASPPTLKNSRGATPRGAGVGAETASAPGVPLDEDALCIPAVSSTRKPPSDGEVPLGCTSPRWKKLGFQSCDPRTDLRTGRLALESLVYFAEHYPLAISQMVMEAQSRSVDYPFAVASINITQHLSLYLGLLKNEGVCAASAGRPVAPPSALRRFARLLLRLPDGDEAINGCALESLDAFGELHAASMACLHQVWKEFRAEHPGATVMHFSSALDQTMATVHRFFLDATMQSALEFRRLWSNVTADASKVDGVQASQLPEPGVQAGFDTESNVALRKSLRDTMRAVSTAAGVYGTYIHGALVNATATDCAARGQLDPNVLGRLAGSGVGFPLPDGHPRSRGDSLGDAAGEAGGPPDGQDAFLVASHPIRQPGRGCVPVPGRSCSSYSY